MLHGCRSARAVTCVDCEVSSQYNQKPSSARTITATSSAASRTDKAAWEETPQVRNEGLDENCRFLLLSLDYRHGTVAAPLAPLWRARYLQSRHRSQVQQLNF